MSNYEYDFGEGLKQYKKIIDGGEADFVPVTTQMAEFCMAHGGHNGHDFFMSQLGIMYFPNKLTQL